MEQNAEAKRRAKRQEQVIKRWTKLVQGLRIRQRLLEQYADRADGPSATKDAGEGQNHEEVRASDVNMFASQATLCSLSSSSVCTFLNERL